MDMDQSAVFLAGSILTALGFVVVVVAAVIINNILHKYWKPVQFTWFESLHEHNNKRFMDTVDVPSPQEDKKKSST